MGSCLSQNDDLGPELNLNHFELQQIIGEGAFGKVRLVVHKATLQEYALKSISKQLCVRQNSAAAVVKERRILEEINHPFICNLRFAFQDGAHCFFVLDLMIGGALGFHLERAGSLPEKIVRYWIAELAVAVGYLHSQGIMHRDIKPFNILLDAGGHAHLADFGCATYFKPNTKRSGTSGTLLYMAPEMLLMDKDAVGSRPASAAGVPDARGYDESVDWWSLGATAYHLLYGCFPFKGKTMKKLVALVSEGRPAYEPRVRKDKPIVVSSDARSLVDNLLVREPPHRLRYHSGGLGVSDIRSHPWFRGIEWECLPKKAPNETISRVVTGLTLGNFSIEHEVDEFFAPRPLLHQKPKKNVDPSKLKPALRMLEADFHDYDYSSCNRHPPPEPEEPAA